MPACEDVRLLKFGGDSVYFIGLDIHYWRNKPSPTTRIIQCHKLPSQAFY
jgi:hypothetical protein